MNKPIHPIRLLRISKQMSSAEFAAAFNVSANLINQVETGYMRASDRLVACIEAGMDLGYDLSEKIAEYDRAFREYSINKLEID